MSKIFTKQISKKCVLGLLGLALPFLGFAQLSITTNTVATSLAQTIVGSGVSVGNANLNCGVYASGTFTDTGADLGLSNGIVLTTGKATQAGGPAVFANYNENTTDGVPTYSDPALIGIGGTSAKYDVCILTFTFVPVCSSINIKYVFGSEEYPKYINSFNDAFGIFLTGPNPLGGNYSLTDIATLPDGYNTPVSIDSVNGGYTVAEGATTPIAASHPSYYVNNYTNGSGNTSAGANGDISYHGYTIPITSSASVTPCQTYTMEIGIADGSNGNYDSGVFIEGNSVSCSLAPALSVSTTSSSCGASTGTASVTVSNFDGTETYTWTPGNLHTADITGLAPGSYTCQVGLNCGLTTYSTVVATVTGPTIPTVTVASSTVCSGSNTSLVASGTASTYTWNTGVTGATLAINNAISNATYTVIGTSATGCTATATGSVTVNSVPTITVSSTSICKGSTGTLTASGTATTYTWNTGATGANLSVSPTSTTVYTVTGTNASSCTNTASGTVTVNTNPTVSVAPQTICPGTTATLVATPASLTSYTWSTGSSASTTTVSPASSTSYTVAGTDANGCVSNTATASVTVSNSSTLTVTATKATACNGVADTLNAVGASSYTWTASNGTSIPSNNAQIIETQTASVTYTVTGSLGGGCTTSPATITVNVSPTITLNIASSPTNAAVCQGNSLTLTASGANTYTWIPSITNGVSFVPASTQVYSVMATDANGCKDSGSISVTVNPLPVIQAVSQPVCPNSTATLTAVPSTTTSIASYTWSTGANASTTTVSVGTTSQGYTVTVTDVNGCVSVPVTDSVIVNSHPTITSLSATKPIACAGVADTITAQGASTYTWVANGVTLSNNTNQIIVTPSVVTHYTVTGTLSGGCMTVPDTISITIDAPISFSITASPSPSVCPGNTVSLSGIPTTYTYTWGGGITNGVAFTPTASATYTVMATDANGCTSAVNNEPVTVFTTTVITISPSSSPVCIGAAQGSTTLTATPSTLSSYTWSTGAVTSTPSIVVTPTANPTTYSVSVTDGNGCMDSTATPLSLPVYTPAPLIITAIGGNTVCSNATTTLTANNGGTSTYTWMPGVTSVSANSNSVTITPTNPTTYSVIGIDANGCVDTASKQIDIVPIPSSLSVTPNNYICSNNPVNSMVVTATNATGYIWVGPAPSTNTVSTSSTPSFTTPGMYTVYAVNSCGQLSAGSTVPLTKDSVTAAITAPTGTLTTGNAPDTVSFAGLGTSTNGIISNTSYNWNFGNGNSSSTQNPTEIYTAPSLIQNIYTATLTVTDSKGCWDTATVKITVNEIPTMIIIPNIFSPNGDGINDVFSIKATGISDFDCKIYDRWGILLHEWTGIDGGWDGKGKNGNNETDGTYFYIINYNDINNKTINKTGFFELVR